MPQGVFHWVHRAKKEATIDATIGVGRGLKSEISENSSSGPTVLHLPSIEVMFNGLEPEEIFPTKILRRQRMMRHINNFRI